MITETPITRNERKIGYLTTEEIGYVMEHSGIVEYGFWGGPVDLTSDDARGPFRKGCQKAHRELSKPPLTSTGEIDRFVYICRRRWYRWWNNDEILTLHRHYAFQKGGVAFRCPICTQAMRLPLGKSVISQCPNCESDVESHT